jgi:hypothetical protein
MILSPLLRQRFFDSNGNPLSGGKLYTYVSGTTTPQATYTDQSGGTPNANPVILDSSGAANVWLDPSLTYKFVLKDSSDVVQFTSDAVSSAISTSQLPDGILSADSTGRAKMADGFTTLVKLADAVKMIPGATWNLGCKYSGSTFSLTAADGTALSASNPAYVCVPSKTAGALKIIQITSGDGFVDKTGSSSIIGNTFGTTATAAWDQACPFYLYACLNDAETAVSFAISRIPHASSVPAVGFCGTPLSSIADTQGSFFFFQSITVAQYDTNPCVCVGSFQMTKSSADDWTVSTLSNSDGIGRFNEGTTFTMPLGQNGAASATYTNANTGTSAVFSNSSNKYWMSRTGKITYQVHMSGDGGTDGSGAVTAIVCAPLKMGGVSGTTSVPVGTVLVVNPTFSDFCAATLDVTGFNMSFGRPTGATNVTWANFSNGSRNIDGMIAYQVDTA